MTADVTKTADAVIVGCGPGGATLAYLLARSGVDVALVERASDFEREFRGFGYGPGVVELSTRWDYSTGCWRSTTRRSGAGSSTSTATPSRSSTSPPSTPTTPTRS